MHAARKLALVLALSTSLGGCAVFNELTGGALSPLTASIKNPIGLDQQYEIEAAIAVARRAAVQYFRLRQCRRGEVESATNLCSRRSIKVAIQDADRKLNIVLVPFRRYVAANDQINAMNAAQAVWPVIKELQSAVSRAGAQ